jgi:hypothetical protein
LRYEYPSQTPNLWLAKRLKELEGSKKYMLHVGYYGPDMKLYDPPLLAKMMFQCGPWKLNNYNIFPYDCDSLKEYMEDLSKGIKKPFPSSVQQNFPELECFILRNVKVIDDCNKHTKHVNGSDPKNEAQVTIDLIMKAVHRMSNSRKRSSKPSTSSRKKRTGEDQRNHDDDDDEES